ncbi:uncharacterized protein B0H64DRAFT_52502 [Chaetomium fimeti]|uniref:Zinc-binding loop region of homing endonuclease domain-containing protein n=1 Tax=Chaetomium fimeti TaxID=1854472 RepID=A0AAE0H694_9PEZI|nr:hypothetical protein B0H64DRAFT_52502 [Chaetomium fimeti]
MAMVSLTRAQARVLFSQSPVRAQESLELRLVSTPKSGFYYNTVLVPSKNGGYVQLSFEGANKFCTLGEMLVWAQGFVVEGAMQVSHLCHDPLCTVAAHVVRETAAENNRRKGCVVWVDCPHCCLKIRVCEHAPICIRYAPGYETLAEFLEWGLHT